MTDENVFTRIVDDETRRSFMKKGAAATVGTVAASGVGSAQVTDGGGEEGGGTLDEGWKALIFVSNFHPRGEFAIVSGVTEWVPNYGDVRDS